MSHTCANGDNINAQDLDGVHRNALIAVVKPLRVVFSSLHRGSNIFFQRDFERSHVFDRLLSCRIYCGNVVSHSSERLLTGGGGSFNGGGSVLAALLDRCFGVGLLIKYINTINKGGRVGG